MITEQRLLKDSIYKLQTQLALWKKYDKRMLQYESDKGGENWYLVEPRKPYIGDIERIAYDITKKTEMVQETFEALLDVLIEVGLSSSTFEITLKAINKGNVDAFQDLKDQEILAGTTARTDENGILVADAELPFHYIACFRIPGTDYRVALRNSVDDTFSKPIVSQEILNKNGDVVASEEYCSVKIFNECSMSLPAMAHQIIPLIQAQYAEGFPDVSEDEDYEILGG